MTSVLANTVVSLIGRVASATIGIGVVAILGRFLGAEGFGLYSLILSLGAILHVVSDGGLYLTLAREIAKHPEEEQKIFSSILGLRVVSLVAVFVVGWVILSNIGGYEWARGLYWIAVVGFFAQSLSQLLVGVFQKYGAMWKVTLGDIVGRCIQLGVVIWLVTQAGGGRWVGSVGGAVIAFSAGAVGAYIVHAMVVPGVRRVLQPRFSAHLWKNVVRQSWPIGALLILNAIYFRIDIVMLSWFRSAAEVGWYGAAYKAIESGLFIPAAFGGLVLPRLASFTGEKKQKLLSQALFVMIILACYIFVVLLLASDELMALFVGSDFLPAGAILSVLSVALAVMFLGNVFGFALVAQEKQKQLLILYGILAVCNTVGNFVLIPRFGAMAAAWTTVATESVACAVAGILAYRTIPYYLKSRDVFGIAGAASLAALTLGALQVFLPTLVSIGIAFVVYGAVLAMLGFLQKTRVSLLIAP